MTKIPRNEFRSSLLSFKMALCDLKVLVIEFASVRALNGRRELVLVVSLAVVDWEMCCESSPTKFMQV